MKAYREFRGNAATADTFVGQGRLQDRRSPFAVDPQLKIHNPRGLVIAILMSAACWAGVGLAFLL